jgi:ribosome-associated protein
MKSEELVQVILDSIEESKAEAIEVIDVRGKTSITDVMIVVSGTSSRHVKSVASNVSHDLKKIGVLPLGVEGEDEGEWVLLDLGDVILHVMQHRTRAFYQLEKLWSVDTADAVAEAP